MEIGCDGCKNIIGKSYKSTTSCTDLYRDTFSFAIDKVKSYTLGSCTLNRRENITESDRIFSTKSLIVVSNAILLSFDAERAANDEEILNKLKVIVDTLTQKVHQLEHTAQC